MHATERLRSARTGQWLGEVLTRDLREALLAFGSETPDNLAAMAETLVSIQGRHLGPATRIWGRLFADHAHAIEDHPMSEPLRRDFPKVSDAEWEVFARVTTLIHAMLAPFVDETQNSARREDTLSLL